MSDVGRLVVTWVALLAVLAISAGAEALVPGTGAHAFSLVCAAVMATLVMTWFMDLRSQSGMLRLFALGGLLWFGFLLFITVAAFLSG